MQSITMDSKCSLPKVIDMLVLWKLMQQMSNQVSTEQFNYTAMGNHGMFMKNSALQKISSLPLINKHPGK